MDKLAVELLKAISAYTEGGYQGAYNIRENGGCAGRQSTDHIQIEGKPDGSGIDIYIKAGTKGEKVYIPACVTHGNVNDVVYNDFHVGEGADVTIIAGCGIHNGGSQKSEHDGIHSFYLEKGAKVRYVEKHYGQGDGSGERIMNPQTLIYMDEDSYMEMDTVQIKGVDSTERVTRAELAAGATLVIREKIMTHGRQYAKTDFEVNLNGENSGAHLISRSVARDRSRQLFVSKINGNNKCSGHSECDAILMDEGIVSAVPEITANHIDSSLIHEAAIGKIAGEQIIKLMTLGLTEKEAEEQIISGFLK